MYMCVYLFGSTTSRRRGPCAAGKSLLAENSNSLLRGNSSKVLIFELILTLC